jgi:teichuronic acid biosynthesis glycosyltransferase TuaH
MDIMVIPFHDWRKSEKEGFRTRDVHFIRALASDKFSNRILVINRPITKLELRYKGFKKYLRGNIVLEDGRCTLTEVDTNIFVVDYHSKDIIGQATHRFKWFMDAYNKEVYKKFVTDACKHLKFETPALLTQNIFAYKLAVSLPANSKVFDAWDNFLKFPGYAHLKKELHKGYAVTSKEIVNWTTNSKENIAYYKQNFKVKQIELLKNGVKANFAAGEVVTPADLQTIKKPWIGFGGKISYLMDTELINFITLDNPGASFVFVGQILD